MSAAPTATVLLSAVIAAIEVRSWRRWSWFGEQAPELPSSAVRRLSSADRRSYLVQQLSGRLYADFYTKGRPVPTVPTMLGNPVTQQAFLAELERANAGHGYWQAGWVVRSDRRDQALVQREGFQLRIPAASGSFRAADTPARDDRGAVRFEKSRERFSPGFYMAFGNVELTESSPSDILRLYWNVSPAAAIRLVRESTTMLNAAGLPFRLKVIADPHAYARADAGVLYVRRADASHVLHLVAEIHASIGDDLRAATPAFSKKLDHGLGLAESPSDGNSFGMHRCQLVAEGLASAWEANARTPQQRLRHMLTSFADHRVDIAAPFLNPGSRDRYERARASRVLTPRPPIDEGRFLAVATEIGESLLRDAIWVHDRCTWLGPDMTAATDLAGARPFRVVGPDLYDGLGGIALFLAELHRVQDEPNLARAARGAAIEAVRRVGEVRPPLRLGLYSGCPGIALAAVRVGLAIRDEEVIRRGHRLARRISTDLRSGSQFDLVNGMAGGILAMLELSRLLDDAALAAWAVRMGDALIRRGIRRDSGLAWQAPGIKGEQPLTGLSHGAAGAALAFLELFARTKESRFRRAAELAFAYEHRWFDPRAGNWADLRVGRQGFMVAWCHGAPGIGITRARAVQVLGDERWAGEAEIALRTTEATLRESLAVGGEDFSLCHGIAGEAEVLLAAARSEGSAVSAADAGLRSYRERALWPHGSAPSESPGLMLGRAGIGWFYLRMYDRRVPSPLFLTVSSAPLRDIE